MEPKSEPVPPKGVMPTQRPLSFGAAVLPQHSKEQLLDNSLIQHIELETDEEVTIRNQDVVRHCRQGCLNIQAALVQGK